MEAFEKAREHSELTETFNSLKIVLKNTRKRMMKNLDQSLAAFMREVGRILPK
jgi:hypothetical protein